MKYVPTYSSGMVIIELFNNHFNKFYDILVVIFLINVNFCHLMSLQGENMGT